MIPLALVALGHGPVAILLEAQFMVSVLQLFYDSLREYLDNGGTITEHAMWCAKQASRILIMDGRVYLMAQPILLTNPSAKRPVFPMRCVLE